MPSIQRRKTQEKLGGGLLQRRTESAEEGPTNGRSRQKSVQISIRISAFKNGVTFAFFSSGHTNQQGIDFKTVFVLRTFGWEFESLEVGP